MRRRCGNGPRGPPRAQLGNQRRSAGAGIRKRQRSQGRYQVQKPGNQRAEQAAEVGSNHAGGTCRSGGTELPTGGNPGRENGKRAPVMSAWAPSERTEEEVSAASRGSRREPGRYRCKLTGGSAAMRGVPSADPPGAGQPDDRPGSNARACASTRAMQVSPPAGGKFQRRGGVCEHGPAREDVEASGVVPRAQSGAGAPAGDREARAHRATEPGWKGARAGREAHEGRRAASSGRKYPTAAHRMVRRGKASKAPPETENAKGAGGEGQPAAAAPGKRRSRGTHPAGSVGGP